MPERCKDCMPEEPTRPTVACSGCRTAVCPAHAHYTIDEANRAITKSALPECAECAGLFWQVVRWSAEGDESLGDYRTPEAARKHAWALNTAHQTTHYTIRRKRIRQTVGATPEGNKG